MFGIILFLATLLIAAAFFGLSDAPLGTNIFSQPAFIKLTDVTSAAGLSSTTRAPIYDENPSYLEVMGGGVAVADVDNDGWEDIFLASMPSFDPDSTQSYDLSVMYLNQGDGTYKNITAETGLDSIRGYPLGALFFDYDNDGFQDLYVASYKGGQLFRNAGGYFVDVTDTAGVSLQGLCGNYSCMAAAASAADYNRDGYLDLLIVNNVDWELGNPAYQGKGSLIPAAYKGQSSFLFRNNGDGTFTDVTEESGVTNYDKGGYRENGKGLSAIWSDFNRDGWPDVFIANDMSPNRLYLNKDGNTFAEIGRGSYVDELKSSMGVDAADFDYSGYMDLVTTNLTGSMTSLFRNYGNLRFDYATYYTGIMPSSRSSGWGIVFTDLDLDGYQDLAMGSGPIWNQHAEAANLIFKNTGRGTFEDVTEEVITFSNDRTTRGVAVTDYDRSGTPDLIFSNIDGEPSQLIKNESTGNNWLSLRLEGVVSNRDAVGASVTVEREDGLKQNQIVVAGNSYMSSGSKMLFFGLGNSTVRELVIRWPSGRTDSLSDVQINNILHITEGSNTGDPNITVSQIW